MHARASHLYRSTHSIHDLYLRGHSMGHVDFGDSASTHTRLLVAFFFCASNVAKLSISRTHSHDTGPSDGRRTRGNLEYQISLYQMHSQTHSVFNAKWKIKKRTLDIIHSHTSFRLFIQFLVRASHNFPGNPRTLKKGRLISIFLWYGWNVTVTVRVIRLV